MKTNEFIIKESELKNTLDIFDIKNTKVAIIGGHYMLLYEKQTNSLRPAVYEEFPEGKDKQFIWLKMKNFALRSFELSIDLFIYFRKNEVFTKCVLLVNDDAPFKKDFRNDVHYEMVKDKGKELRKRYFYSKDSLPSTYEIALKKNKLQVDDFFHIFESKNHSEDSYLPEKTIFVSEKKLCRNFKKTIKAANSDNQLFKVLNIEQPEPDNIIELTVVSKTINTVCLISKGVCNCGGKAFQFYYELLKAGYDTIIFFVPKDCNDQVTEGTELICTSNEFSEKKITIINIGNIESAMQDIDVEKTISVNYYTNELT